MKRVIGMSALCLVLFIVACSKESGLDDNNNGGNNSLDCTSVSKTFSKDVKSIIANSCTASSCHNSGSSNGPGELLTFAQIAAAKVAVRAAVASGSMPKGSSLTSVQKNTILCWIDSGAQDN